MSVPTLLAYLRQQGAELSIVGDRLRCNAPKGVLTPALLKELAEHKEELLDLLRAGSREMPDGSAPPVPEDLPSQERIGSPSQIPISRIPRDGELPLSFAQERLWFLDQLEPGSPVYNIPLALRLMGDLDIPTLQRSINEIVRRHEVFRTTVREPHIQVILPTLDVSLPQIDLQGLPAADREACMLDLARGEAQRPFDFSRGPFLRATLFWLNAKNTVVLLVTHHFVMDGWSVGLFFYELVTLYQAFSAGRASPLPELPIQYVDFAHWQRQWLQGETLEAELSYWKQQLGGSIPVLQLPTDRPRPKQQTSHGSTQVFALPQELTQALKMLCRRERVTLFMILLAAFQALLYRYTLQEDIIVATAISNRGRNETESLIGSFVNNLVLRSDLSGNPTFRELLGRVREVALGAYAHQDLPFEKLLEELKPERDLSRTPLFQVMFLLQTPRTRPLELPGLRVTPLAIDSGTAMFDLLLDMTDTEEGLQGRLEYNTDLFDQGTIARLLGHYQTLLAGIVAHPEQGIADLPLLTEIEREQLLSEWNATRVLLPSDECLPRLFETQVERTPQAVAVVCQERQLTYSALNQRANRLAHCLHKRGVGAEKLVAVLDERGENLLTVLLAIFKAGGVYLPLDPHHPPQRQRQVLEQSGCQFVLAAKTLASTLTQIEQGMASNTSLHILSLEDLLQEEAAAENIGIPCAPTQLAYVIYTSGSTGTPKGAMIEHRGMLNHLYAKISALRLTESDIVAQTASQCFDISIWQFLAVLLVGGQVHIFPDAVVHDPKQLIAEVECNHISILETVPSLLRVQLEMLNSPDAPHYDLASLRWLIPTGEALQPELCCQWLRLYPKIPLLNAYGPTECSDDVTHDLIDRLPAEHTVHTPIGRPIQNTQIYILSPSLSLMPIGIPGELHVGGICVGRGYLNRPELTAAQFLPDPFSLEPGARLYRTGDLARSLPDGTIEYLERIDYQVKLRGFRIELGEIEAVLSQHPAVRQALALVWKTPSGSEHLTAYVVLRQQEVSEIEASPMDLRSFLEERLPDYMMPSDFIYLKALPLTPNGKVDRRVLPAPEHLQTGPRERFIAPRDLWELQVAQIWEDLLERQPVGVNDNFFELGGHSLLVMRLIAQIQKRFGRTISIATLFQKPTIEHLASILRQQPGPMVWSPLVGMQTHGTGLPFFCVHPIGGNVICYVELARSLDADQPFYGLQARGATGEEHRDQEPLTTIEDMAASYIEAVRQVQSEGPYLLGGWSMGGLIAFEMARQLHAQGQNVALLALIDTRVPGEEQLPEADDDEIELLATLFHENAPLPVHGLRQLEPEQRLLSVLEEARKARRLPPDIGFSQALRLLRLQKIHMQAARNYKPHAYSGQITFFQPQEQSIVGVGLNWNTLALGGVRVHPVPGNHWTMLHEPHIREIAARLQADIQKVKGG